MADFASAFNQRDVTLFREIVRSARFRNAIELEGGRADRHHVARHHADVTLSLVAHHHRDAEHRDADAEVGELHAPPAAAVTEEA